MSGFINNKIKVVLNPFTKQLELQTDVEAGITVRNRTFTDFTIKNGFTCMHPNLIIPDGKIVTVEDGGELIVL